MRATFITTGLQKGAQIEEFKKPLGTAIRARQNYMTGAGTTPRRQRAFWYVLMSFEQTPTELATQGDLVWQEAI
jgi:hypothetical protein